MANKGWISVSRSLQDHWVWDCEFSYGQAWVDLLINANHKPTKVMIKSQIIALERGDQARSHLTLSKQWKWSRNKVLRFLKNLEKDGMIKQKTGHLTTVISICNYSSFQTNDTSDGTTEGHLTEQQKDIWRNTDNNVNNENNENKDTTKAAPSSDSVESVNQIFIESGVTEEQVSEIRKIRKDNKGGKITERVAKTLLIEFQKAGQQGWSLEAMLNEWATRSWKSFKADWIKDRQQLTSQERNAERNRLTFDLEHSIKQLDGL